MKTAAEYREHAEQCRLLARQTNEPSQREQLLRMAQTWDKLAETRERASKEGGPPDASKKDPA
jgi:hypothetical protein